MGELIELNLMKNVLLRFYCGYVASRSSICTSFFTGCMYLLLILLQSLMTLLKVGIENDELMFLDFEIVVETVSRVNPWGAKYNFRDLGDTKC